MISVIGNLKGGSGKSTVSFNLSVWLATFSGGPVHAFDLDPQKTFSDVMEVRIDEGFEPTFDVQHASPDLAVRLKESDGEVLVDVGTMDMEALKTAIAVADRVIVPVPPSQADIWSTQRFLGIVEEAAAGRNIEVLCFVNRADTHHSVTESDEAEEALATLNGITLIRQRLYQRTAYRRSFSEGLGVFELEPNSKASKEFLLFAEMLYPKYV